MATEGSTPVGSKAQPGSRGSGSQSAASDEGRWENKVLDDEILMQFAATMARDRRSTATPLRLVEDSEDEEEADVSEPSGGDLDEDAVIEIRRREYELLSDAGDRMRRISAMQRLNMYAKGRVAMAGPRMGPERMQKVFNLESSEVLMSLEEVSQFVDRLKSGVLVTQVIARTGLGKTTKFSPMIASGANMRVLLVEPDASTVAAAVEVIQREGIAPYRKRWLKTREPSVTVMTYADFTGQFQSRNAERMLQQFDVVVLDEAHLPLCDTYVARALLATHYTGTFSIVLLTATMDGEDTQVLNQVAPVQKLNGDLMSMVRDGAIFSKHRCKDRTLLLVANDQEVHEVKGCIERQGMIAYTLDSASRPADRVAVFEAFSRSSVNVRFLVAIESYGTGLNCPLSQVYSDAVRDVVMIDGDGQVVSKRIGVTVSEVKQHAGRVGRGFMASSVAFVFNDDMVEPDVELLESERLKAYLTLRACGVKPLQSVLPDMSLIPFGITPTVAQNILAINLPPEIAIRFFNKDGALPVAYARALSSFSNVDHYFVSTAAEEPLGYDTWKHTPAGGYYGVDVASRATVKVPVVVADDAIMLKLQVISALAAGRISYGSYVPNISEDELSEEESAPVVIGKTKLLPRLVVQSARVKTVEPRVARWAYSVPEVEQLDMGRLLDGGSYARARGMILAGRDDANVKDAESRGVEYFSDHRGVSRVRVVADENAEKDEDMTLKTPGGTFLAQFRATAYNSLLAGDALSESDAISLFKAIKHNASVFATSYVFDHWNNAWLGILRTLRSHDIVQRLAQNSLLQSALTLLGGLYVRFTQGVEKLVLNSHVRAKFWDRIGKRSFADQFERDKAKGKIEVVQSESLLRRLAMIRSLSTEVIDVFEQNGWFAPETSTKMQDLLPIRMPKSSSLTSRDEVGEAARKGKVRHFRMDSR